MTPQTPVKRQGYHLSLKRKSPLSRPELSRPGTATREEMLIAAERADIMLDAPRIVSKALAKGWAKMEARP